MKASGAKPEIRFKALRIAVLLILLGFALCLAWVHVPSSRSGDWGFVEPPPEVIDSLQPEKTPELERLYRMTEALAPLHEKYRRFERESVQGSEVARRRPFKYFLLANPRTPDDPRKKIHMLPIGDLNASQIELASTMREYLEPFFGVPVETLERAGLRDLPPGATRIHPSWGVHQTRTFYLFDDVLLPRLSDDSAACIGYLAGDIWPGEGYNYVFGQALRRKRVAVWSMHRLGEFGVGGEGSEESLKVLRRNMRIVTHETGHVFGLEHCGLYECNMCKSDHLGMFDNNPIWMCPECAAKICWVTRCDPIKRYRALAEFCERVGLDAEAEFYRRSAEMLAGE